MQHCYASVVSSTYIVNSLAQIAALRRVAGHEFVYRILCMDRRAEALLRELGGPGVEPVFVDDFEDNALRDCRAQRTLTEYCWTVKPPFLLHLLESNPQLAGVTFLDADIYPFSSLTPLWDVLAGCDVVLYPHNFLPKLDFLNVNSGKYNAGMISARNTPAGRDALRWWTERCIEWCFAVNEPDRLGDQKYLLRFGGMFDGVTECAHRGIDVGPWGIDNFRPYCEGGEIWLDRDTKLMLYHFHQYNYNGGRYVPASEMYPISLEARELIYAPYTAAYAEALRAVERAMPEANPGPIIGKEAQA